MDATAAVSGGPWWVQLIYVALAAIMSVIASPWLLRKAAEAKAKATDASLSARRQLLSMVQQYLYIEASNFAEKRFPELAQWVVASGCSKDKDCISILKSRLREWGEDLKYRAVEHFRKQGLDVVAALGDDMLDDFIESAANHVSPFPGADTAKALLQDHVSDWLINKGVDYARKQWLRQEA